MTFFLSFIYNELMLSFLKASGFFLKRASNFLKKAFIVIAVYIVVINLFFYFLNKGQKNTTVDPLEQSRKKIYQTINDPKLNSTKEGKMNVELYRVIICGMVGEACTDNPKDGNKNFHHSLFGYLTKLIVLPYGNPPSSGVFWAYSGLQNAGFVPKTYAAGIGFAALAPFQEIWLLFRNFVFLLFVLIIIAIGFMIMFRAKINPQTIISVENALPKIVIALILITFSYAIAGFLIDLMYVVIGFVVVLFGTNPNLGLDQNQLFDQYYFSTGSVLWHSLTPVGPSSLLPIASAIYNLLPVVLQVILNTISTVLFGKLAVAVLGRLIPAIKFVDITRTIAEHLKASGTVVASLVAALILVVIEVVVGDALARLFTVALLALILALSLVFIYFRIFFMLLYAYLNVLLLILFSPLILALEAFPGKSSFSSWIKNLIINLFTFPLLVLLTLVVKVIINTPIEDKVLWRPPYLFSINPEAFRILIAGAILYMIPDLVKSFKELVGIKPLPVSLNFGAFFAGAQATGGGALGLLGRFSSISLGLQALGIGVKPEQRTGLARLLGGPGKATSEETSASIDGGAKAQG